MKFAPMLSVIWRLALVAASAVFYAGFYFTDPYMSGAARALMWAARLGIPPLVAGLLCLPWLLRAGKVRAAHVGLALGAVALTLLLCFPAASYVYHHHSLKKRLDRYHPYLQLTPPLYHERNSASDSKPLRVFCLGGSTTEFTDAEGRGWPARVAERLRAAQPERTVEVHNLGRQWYTSLHSLINYEVNLQRHKPDVLVIMHAVNDLLHNADFSRFSFGPFRRDYGHFYGPVSRVVDRRTVFQLFLREAAATWYWKPREVLDIDDFPGAEVFADNIRTLIALARFNGAGVLLVTQPYLYRHGMTPEETARLRMLENGATGHDARWSIGTAIRGMDAYNDTVRALAKSERVALADAEPRVPKALEYFTDDVHYTRRAFELIAEEVAGGVADLLEKVSD